MVNSVNMHEACTLTIMAYYSWYNDGINYTKSIRSFTNLQYVFRVRFQPQQIRNENAINFRDNENVTESFQVYARRNVRIIIKLYRRV